MEVLLQFNHSFFNQRFVAWRRMDFYYLGTTARFLSDIFRPVERMAGKIRAVYTLGQISRALSLVESRGDFLFGRFCLDIFQGRQFEERVLYHYPYVFRSRQDYGYKFSPL